jgi:hypothetical protein
MAADGDREPATHVSCIEPRADGSPCYLPAFVFDPRRRGMLCREHALEPLERAFGARPDLEEKAELVLRFLSLPSEHRREVLHGLSAKDRLEIIAMAQVFNLEDH